MGKQAVVVIIDLNQSMNQPLDATSQQPQKTRLDCAKEVAIGIISDLMIESKTNEVAVLALHTKETKILEFAGKALDDYAKDKYYDDKMEEDSGKGQDNPFCNIMDFSGNGEVKGFRQPLPDLLEKIHNLQVPSTKIDGGDLGSGIIYATDSLYQNKTKDFQRRIVLLTDAEHKIAQDVRLTTSALDCLRDMKTRLEVVGMNFESSGDFDTATPKVKTETGSSNDNRGEHHDSDSETDEGDESDGSEAEEDIVNDVKRPNEKFLVTFAQKIGGFVFAAKELQAMLGKMWRQGAGVSKKYKLLFEIAPDHVLEDARYYPLLLKNASTPLNKKLVMVDGNNQPQINALGDEMYQDMDIKIKYVDPETGEHKKLVSGAYKYQSELIPFNAPDHAGLGIPQDVKLSIVGYAEIEQVPDYLWIGPPYVLTGHESRRCCATISALAQALQQTNKVAIATFVKSKNNAPLLCGLFPLEEGVNPIRLAIMRLPFAEDVKGFLQLPSLDDVVGKENQKAFAACDNMIDNLMLPDDALDYSAVPNPKVRAFYKTVASRVIDKESPVVDFRSSTTTGTGSSKANVMETPDEIVEMAHPAVAAFYDSFSLTNNDNS